MEKYDKQHIADIVNIYKVRCQNVEIAKRDLESFIQSKEVWEKNYKEILIKEGVLNENTD